MTRGGPKTLPCAVLLLVAVATATFAQSAREEAQQAAVTLEQLEQMALQNNPTLRQASAAVEAARGRARQAGAWPNPMVGYTGDEINRGEVIRGGEHGFFIEQTIPLGGKLRLSRAAFERESSQAESIAALQEQRVRAAVRTLFYETLTVDRRVEVLDRLSQLVVEAVDISRQLYNVGAADRPDVLETEIEARRAQLDATAARNRAFAVRRQLAAVVGDTAIILRPLAGSIDAALPELERDSTLRALLDKSPAALIARAEIERNRALVARARRESFPDLFVRAAPMYNRELLEIDPSGQRRDVGWEASLEAGITVPLFNRNQGGIAAARAEQSRAEAELRRVELSIEAGFASLFEEYLTSLRSAEVYRTEILPRAEEAYRLYLARYREMAAAYPQVLIALRSLLELNDEYLRNLETAWRTALRIQGLLVEDDGLAAPERTGESQERATAAVSRKR